MIYDVERFTDYLVQLKLTPTQFYICWLIEQRDTDNLEKYLKGVGKFDSEDFIYLIDKGYLIDVNPKGKEFTTGNLIVTLEFKEMLVDEEEAFDELLNIYPKFVTVNGVRFPTTGFTLHEHLLAKQAYQKVIKNNKYLHVKILSLIDTWKKSIGENAPFKVDKFITSKYWEQLEGKVDEYVQKPRNY